MKRKNKFTIDKYNYGSYVITNQQTPYKDIKGPSFGGSALSGASTGASMGSSLGPMGMIGGAIIGAVGGLFGASNKERKAREQRLDIRNQFINNFEDQYEGNIDSVNETPYGTYEKGGQVLPSITPINIEKGELQIDPETGKILREFKGINPETGGKYEPHKDKGRDSKNNFVTAEEGTFIVTKEKAKQYKDALDNNDKLQQNTIMHNIRNKKRQSMKFGGPKKYANGGQIAPVASQGVTPNLSLNTGPASLSVPNIQQTPVITPTQSNFNWGNVANTAVNALPAVANLIQGLSSPDYVSTSLSPANPYKNSILSNLPRDINYTPLLNRIYRDRNTAYRNIDTTTNSSAVARANKLNVLANTQRGIQSAYLQGEEANNRTRLQRAGIYDKLAQEEQDRYARDRDYNYGVGMTNRQMAEGRRQQLNYGLSQLQQMYQSLNTNRQIRDRDDMRSRILEQIFPALTPYLSSIYGTGGNNG